MRVKTGSTLVSSANNTTTRSTTGTLRTSGSPTNQIQVFRALTRLFGARYSLISPLSPIVSFQSDPYNAFRHGPFTVEFKETDTNRVIKFIVDGGDLEHRPSQFQPRYITYDATRIGTNDFSSDLTKTYTIGTSKDYELIAGATVRSTANPRNSFGGTVLIENNNTELFFPYSSPFPSIDTGLFNQADFEDDLPFYLLFTHRPAGHVLNEAIFNVTARETVTRTYGVGDPRVTNRTITFLKLTGTFIKGLPTLNAGRQLYKENKTIGEVPQTNNFYPITPDKQITKGSRTVNLDNVNNVLTQISDTGAKYYPINNGTAPFQKPLNVTEVPSGTEGVGLGATFNSEITIPLGLIDSTSKTFDVEINTSNRLLFTRMEYTLVPIVTHTHNIQKFRTISNVKVPTADAPTTDLQQIDPLPEGSDTGPRTFRIVKTDGTQVGSDLTLTNVNDSGTITIPQSEISVGAINNFKVELTGTDSDKGSGVEIDGVVFISARS